MKRFQAALIVLGIPLLLFALIALAASHHNWDDPDQADPPAPYNGE